MTQKYTLNQFQEQCATTAIYGEKINEILKPIQTLVEESYKNGSMSLLTCDEAVGSLEYVRSLLNLSYAVLGLAGEAGEVANKMKKVIRDGTDFTPLNKEVQGTHWYVNACYSELKVDANSAAVQLAETLQSRQERGVLQGNGDNR